MPIRPLSPPTSLLLSTSSTLPSFESAVYLSALTLLPLTPSLTLHINPPHLRFTISLPIPVSLTPATPNSPLFPLAALSSLELSIRDGETTKTTLIRGGKVLENTSRQERGGKGTTLNVWELFYRLPVRLRVEAARNPLQREAAVQQVIVALSLSNPRVEVSLFASNGTGIYSSGIGGELSIGKLVRGFGELKGADWIKVKGGVIEEGFIARGGVAVRPVCVVGIEGDVLLGGGWIKEVVDRLWKKWKGTGGKGRRYLGFVAILKGKGIKRGEKENVQVEMGVERAVLEGLEGKRKREKRERRVEIREVKKRKVEMGRFEEGFVSKKVRHVSRWEEGGEIRRELMRGVDGGEMIVRTLKVGRRVGIGRGSGEEIERVYRRNVVGWKNPYFRGKARVGKEMGEEGLNKMVGNRGVSITKEKIGKLRIVGQVDKKFIMVVDEEAMLYAVDQHAASERYMYEMLLKKTSAENIESVKLIVPKMINMGYQQRITTECHLSTLEHWGWKVRIVNGSVRLIRAPYLTKLKVLVDGEEQLCNYVESLRGGCVKQLTPQPIIEAVASAACHSAVRFGDDLCEAQCNSLVHSLRECESPFICAHGRPSIVPLTLFE